MWKKPKPRVNIGKTAWTTKLRHTESSFKAIPGIRIVSAKSNFTYTTELITEPTIAAVTSPSIDHGIIAPVTPAAYVNTKIKLPPTHVA